MINAISLFTGTGGMEVGFERDGARILLANEIDSKASATYKVSLDLQNGFPLTKGFSARNLWSMKIWYSFYSSSSESGYLFQNLTEQLDLGSIKLNQIGAEIEETTIDEKLNQLGAEMRLPTVFGFVPWRHHVEIVNKCKTVEEKLVDKLNSYKKSFIYEVVTGKIQVLELGSRLCDCRKQFIKKIKKYKNGRS